jgi:hypothetical protein
MVADARLMQRQVEATRRRELRRNKESKSKRERREAETRAAELQRQREAEAVTDAKNKIIEKFGVEGAQYIVRVFNTVSSYRLLEELETISQETIQPAAMGGLDGLEIPPFLDRPTPGRGAP